MYALIISSEVINTFLDLLVESKLLHLREKIIPINIFSDTSLTTAIVNDVGVKGKFTVLTTTLNTQSNELLT